MSATTEIASTTTSAQKGRTLPSRSVIGRGKRFFLDIQEDPKRKIHFLKFTENYLDSGKRSRIHLPLNMALGLRDFIPKFEKFCLDFDKNKKPTGEENGNATNVEGSAGGSAGDNAGDRSRQRNARRGGYLYSKILLVGNRRCYLDLIETKRGTPLLRITQVNLKGFRFSVGVPAHLLKDVRIALAEVLEEFGVKDIDAKDIPAPRHLHDPVSGKIFHFDPTKNYLGLALRISEVNKSYRDSIQVPMALWTKFRNLMDDYVQKCPEPAVVNAIFSGRGSGSDKGSEKGTGSSNSTKTGRETTSSSTSGSSSTNSDVPKITSAADKADVKTTI